MADGCAWPECKVLSPLFNFAGEDDQFFCGDHVTDDFLPAYVDGPIGKCFQCGRSAMHYIEIAPSEWLCLHPTCRRSWAWVQVLGERRGAYGRRSSKS